MDIIPDLILPGRRSCRLQSERERLMGVVVLPVDTDSSPSLSPFFFLTLGFIVLKLFSLLLLIFTLPRLHLNLFAYPKTLLKV